MTKIKLDHRVVRDILRGQEMQDYLMSLAEEVGADVSSQISGHKWENVDVRIRLTDRASGVVEIPGYNSGIYQVRDGVFTKAASNAGLRFRDSTRGKK